MKNVAILLGFGLSCFIAGMVAEHRIEKNARSHLTTRPQKALWCGQSPQPLTGQRFLTSITTENSQ